MATYHQFQSPKIDVPVPDCPFNDNLKCEVLKPQMLKIAWKSTDKLKQTTPQQASLKKIKSKLFKSRWMGTQIIDKDYLHDHKWPKWQMENKPKESGK